MPKQLTANELRRMKALAWTAVAFDLLGAVFILRGPSPWLAVVPVAVVPVLLGVVWWFSRRPTVERDPDTEERDRRRFWYMCAANAAVFGTLSAATARDAEGRVGTLAAAVVCCAATVWLARRAPKGTA